MPNPILNLVKGRLRAPSVPQALRPVVGLAGDFWKDGPENPFLNLFLSLRRGITNAFPATDKRKEADEHVPDTPDQIALRRANRRKAETEWHAEAGQISEKMFGDGFVTPGAAFITEKLIGPLGLTKDMSVLDLSAGLGGRIRKIAKETGAYVTGLEPDPGVAARGMALSIRAGKGKHAPIEHYTETTLSLPRMYDGVIARETFYRVKDKPLLLRAIAAHLKPKGQVTFTDYILNPESRDRPAVKEWLAVETIAAPLGLIEMAEAWAKVGINLRVHEDLTDYYKKEVMKGMYRLSLFLNSGVTPDAETKKSLQKRVRTWTHRMAAMEEGLKFYRFYGTKT